jgi:hypothetical protein
MAEETIEQGGITSVISEPSARDDVDKSTVITEASDSNAHEDHSQDILGDNARSKGVLPRTSVSRDSDQREQPWKPSPILPVPDKREGIDHRWVRSSMRGQSDNINVSQALRDGWVPVLAVDYPELQVINDRNSQYQENVEVGGLLLCKRPSHIGDKIRVHAMEEVRGQMEAVDRNYFREESARMPMLEAERRTRASKFGDD